MTVRYNRRWDQVNRSQTSLKSFVDSYTLFLRAEGKSPETIRSYAERLRGFRRWLEDRGYPADLGQVSREGEALPDNRREVLCGQR